MSSRQRRRKEAQLQQRAPTDERFHLILYAGRGHSVAPAISSYPKEQLAAITVCGETRPVDLPDEAVWVQGDRTSSRNKAAQRGNCAYLLFADADAFLDEPEMLNILVARLHGFSVVGPLVIEAQGERAICAGYAIGPSGQPYYRFKGWPPDHFKLTRPLDSIQAVPILFMATHRQVFRRVGGFRAFGDVPYVEVDYALQAREYGPVCYEPAVRVNATGDLIGHRGVKEGTGLLMTTGRLHYDEWMIL